MNHNLIPNVYDGIFSYESRTDPFLPPIKDFTYELISQNNTPYIWIKSNEKIFIGNEQTNTWTDIQDLLYYQFAEDSNKEHDNLQKWTYPETNESSEEYCILNQTYVKWYSEAENDNCDIDLLFIFFCYRDGTEEKKGRYYEIRLSSVKDGNGWTSSELEYNGGSVWG